MWIHQVGPMRGFGYHPWWWFFGNLIPWLLMLALIGVLAWAVVRFTRERQPGGMARGPGWPSPAARPDAALEQVRMRYARGEVGREEYVQVLRDLGAPEPPSAPVSQAAASEPPPDG